MTKPIFLKALSAGILAAALLASAAFAENFDIPGGDLKPVLDAYRKQTGIALMFSADAVKGARSNGARGDLSANETRFPKSWRAPGLVAHRHSAGAIAIVRGCPSSNNAAAIELAAASAPT